MILSLHAEQWERHTQYVAPPRRSSDSGVGAQGAARFRSGKDFVAMIIGLPSVSGEKRVEEDLKAAIENITGPHAQLCTALVMYGPQPSVLIGHRGSSSPVFRRLSSLGVRRRSVVRQSSSVAAHYVVAAH